MDSLKTTEVENWPGEKEILGPDNENMEDHARNLGCEIISEHVSKVNLTERPFFVETDSGAQYLTESVILATGAQQTGWVSIMKKNIKALEFRLCNM